MRKFNCNLLFMFQRYFFIFLDLIKFEHPISDNKFIFMVISYCSEIFILSEGLFRKSL